MAQGKVIIHVGGPKTGTTALQIALSENRKDLRSQGILYPGDKWHHANALYPIRRLSGFKVLLMMMLKHGGICAQKFRVGLEM